jgi:hypothetical protein
MPGVVVREFMRTITGTDANAIFAFDRARQTPDIFSLAATQRYGPLKTTKAVALRRTKEGRFDTALWQPRLADSERTRPERGEAREMPAFARGSAVGVVRSTAERLLRSPPPCRQLQDSNGGSTTSSYGKSSGLTPT